MQCERSTMQSAEFHCTEIEPLLLIWFPPKGSRLTVHLSHFQSQTALTSLYYFEPLGPRLFSTGQLEPFSVQVPDWPAPHFPISVIFSLGRATFYFSARPQIRLKVVPVKSCLWFSFNPKGTGTCTLSGLQCIVYQCATLIVLNHPVVLTILDKYTPRLKDRTLLGVREHLTRQKVNSARVLTWVFICVKIDILQRWL